VAAESTRPRFTVVSAVYDVAGYLPDFIESIEQQDYDLSRVEVVMVDDGSTDTSLSVLEDWAARRPDLVRVLSQPNAGQGAARNAGLSAARGAWVTFPDPDDVLDPNYLSTVDAFLDAHPDAVMVAANRVIWNETTGATKNSHPLRRMFTSDRLVDLDLAESSFHGSAPAAFFDLDLLREHDLRFESRIRPNFEDGHFCASYLLRCERPSVGFLTSTRYHYRKRADQSSSLQRSMQDPRRYTDVFEFGYLAVLDDAEKQRGHVPLWLQHFLCYELLAYLVAHDVGRVPVLEDEAALESFHDSVGRITARLDLDRVLPRLEFGSRPEHRLALAHGYATDPWHEEQVLVDRFDDRQQLARVRYHFTGTAPIEAVHNGEDGSGPAYAKTRALRWFGRVLLQERILWVRVDPDLRIALDGRWADLVLERPAPATIRMLPRALRRALAPKRERAQAPSRTSWRARRREARDAARYADAWLLADRVERAGDNGEVVFRALRTQHPGINAWFAVSDESPDWQRLRAAFGDRVVAHGSRGWDALTTHCTELLSSSVDPRIIEAGARSGRRFTYLQHGVTTTDVAGELGTTSIDLLVTSTADEHTSIAGDGTAYPFTTKEVRLTGLPRFDRLREADARTGAGQRDLVLVAPTWRRWLSRRPAAGSDFVRQWSALLGSPELADECRSRGLTLALLAHPELTHLLPELALPAHVQVLQYDAQIADTLARAHLFVTDYSSTAFDAAYLDRPVVYFQFDADLVLTGAHVGRRGWFDARRDGFGPVTESVDGTLEAIRAALEREPTAVSPYAERIAAAFPQRDGRCAERVIAAVRGDDA
jgi:glycosyltransferase involved in cell wall biosynthesis